MSSELHQLSGAYALDALETAERADFEEHLAGCPSCSEEVASFQAAAAWMGTGSATEPPPGVVDALMARVARAARRPPSPGAPTAPPTAGPDVAPPAVAAARGRLRRGPWVLVAAALAAAAVAVAFGVRAVQSDGRLDRLRGVTEVAAAADARTVELRGPAGTARLVWTVEQGRAALLAGDLPGVDVDQTYQLWLLRPGGPTPSVLFRPDGDGGVARVVDVQLDGSVEGLGVTVEPRRGSTRPTGEVVLSGDVRTV